MAGSLILPGNQFHIAVPYMSAFGGDNKVQLYHIKMLLMQCQHNDGLLLPSGLQNAMFSEHRVELTAMFCNDITIPESPITRYTRTAATKHNLYQI